MRGNSTIVMNVDDISGQVKIVGSFALLACLKYHSVESDILVLVAMMTVAFVFLRIPLAPKSPQKTAAAVRRSKEARMSSSTITSARA